MNAHFNNRVYSYIDNCVINGKYIKSACMLNTSWGEFLQICENEKNAEIQDLCIENGKIVTDPKRKAEIKENAKKQIAQAKAIDEYEDAIDRYEDAMEELEDAKEEYEKSMRKMNADMQKMQQRFPMFYTMQPWWHWYHPFAGAVNKYANNFKVKKQKKLFKLMKKYKPKANYPKTDWAEQAIVDYKPIGALSTEELRQMAFDNLLSTLAKDLNPDQFAVYSNLIDMLRENPNGNPESIIALYNSMFQGEKEISEVETMPPQYEIEYTPNKLNDTANKSKNTINDQEILQGLEQN